MGKENGYEFSPKNPGWLNTKVPETYFDDDLMQIILFYVIYTPCDGPSAKGIPLTKYGWGKDVWKNDKLKNRLFEAARIERKKDFYSRKKT